MNTSARAITAIALALLLLLLTMSPPQTHIARACSIAPSTFEEDVQRATYIAVVEAIEVGGAANEQPALPTPTASQIAVPDATETPAASQTKGPKPTRTPTLEATSTATAEPSPTPFPMPDLTGMRATLRTTSAIAGDPPPEFVIDTQGRAAYEAELRRLEALIYPRTSCSPGSTLVYVPGEAYVVFANRAADSLSTGQRFDVDGSRVFFANVMERATYDRYFAGIPARFDSGTYEDGSYSYATIEGQWMLLDTLARAIAEIRDGRLGIIHTITPPNTGSAGLKH